MRVLAAVLALNVMLTAAPTSAQVPAPTQPAPQSQTKPAAPAPRQTAPAAPAPRPQTQTPTTPQQPAAPQPPPPLPPPFKEGFKYTYINIQIVASQSAEGKSATTEINKLRDQRQRELNDKNKALQTAQQKLESISSVGTDAARAQLQSEIERQQRDIERSAEDAQQDVERLTQRLQQEFMVKLNPIIDRVAKEKQVDMIFSTESGLVWAAAGMELTTEVIRALDGGATAKPSASAPAPATPPAAGAPAPAPGGEPAPAPATPPAPGR